MKYKKSIYFFRKFNRDENSQINSMIFQTMSMAISFFTILLIPIFHNIEVTGKFVFFLTAQQISGFAISMGVSSYSIRVLNRTSFISDVIKLLFCHCFIILAFIFVFCFYFYNKIDEIFLISIVIWIGLLRYVLEDICTGLRWFGLSSLISLAETFIRFVLVLYTQMHSDSEILFVLIISTCSSILICIFPIINKVNFSSKLKINIKYILVFYRNSIVMYSSHISALLQGRYPVVIAPNFLSPKEVGLFALILSLSEITLRCGNLINKYIYSISAKKGNNFNSIKNLSIVKYVIFISIILCIFMALSFKYIDIYFYDGKIKNMQNSFLILLIYSFIFLYFNITSNILYGLGKSAKVILSSCLGLAASAILLIYLNTNSVEYLCIAMAFGAAISGIYNKLTIRKIN